MSEVKLPPRVFGMCRRSTGTSVHEEVSIAEQKAAIRKYRKEHLSAFRWAPGCFPEEEPSGFFVDRGVSAWKNPFHKRPGASRILHEIRSGDYLLIYSVDRGFRNVCDFGSTIAELAKAGVNVIFVTQEAVNFSKASGKLIGNILATIAQYSSDIKSERIREAHMMRKLGLVSKGRKSEPFDCKAEMLEHEVCYPDELRIKHVPDTEQKSGRIFPYIRCSHQKRLESGLGLAVQEKAVQEYADKLAEESGGLLTKQDMVADEAVSAFSKRLNERPGGKEIYDQLQEGDHLVVYRLDRAWRSLQDATTMIDEMMKRGIHIHLVSDGLRSDSDMGKLHFYTLGYIAWVESYLVSMRGKQIAKHLREAGRPVNQEGSCMKIVKVRGKKKLTLDPVQIAREKWVYDLKKQTGLGRVGLSHYIEKWEAEQQGRPVRPVKSPETAVRCRRYWTPQRVWEACRRSEEFVAIAEKHGITLPDPMELHAQGKLIVDPERSR